MSTTTTHRTRAPEITTHVEPESQALTAGEPATYFRCEACGTEAMRRDDLLGEAHAGDCSSTEAGR